MVAGNHENQPQPLNSNLLIILNRRAEDPVCRLFLPFWQRSGCDLIFSSPIDAQSQLPDVNHIHFGLELTAARSTYWHYQARVLDTMKWCLTQSQYDGFIFTQYDSICLDRLPYIHPSDSVHLIGGGAAPPFKSTFFLHPPWCFGYHRLAEFVAAAARYDIRETETGIMDRWLSLIIEEHCMPFTPCSWAWSVNSIDTPEYIACAKQAIMNKRLFIHGVKNEEQLKAILP